MFLFVDVSGVYSSKIDDGFVLSSEFDFLLIVVCGTERFLCPLSLVVVDILDESIVELLFS